MALFGQRRTSCPICDEGLLKNETRSHWHQHITQIPQGHGDASGQYTWNCVCGPSGLKWPKESGAWAGLMLHMQQRHGIQM